MCHNLFNRCDSQSKVCVTKNSSFLYDSSTTTTAASADVITSLKAELERCLVSNKQKRSEVTELKEEVRKAKKDMLEYRQRCERAELLSHEQKVSPTEVLCLYKSLLSLIM